MLENKLIVFNNTQGKYSNNLIPTSIQITKNRQILDNWTMNDISFINYNIKCILELQKNDTSSYKQTLITTYISLIEEYCNNINFKTT